MSRKAVTMSEADFEALVIAWTNKLTNAAGYQTFESPQEEADYRAKWGDMNALDMYVNNAMRQCVEAENQVYQDITKIQVDFENVGCTLGKKDPVGFWSTSTGIPVLGCHVGGDWEDPVFFVLYPETATTIRAYVPKDGNTYVLKTKTAYGNDKDEDPEENPRKADISAFRADVEKRIKVD